MACQPSEPNEPAPAPEPTMPSSRDSSLVGDWKLTSGGNASLMLKEDGTSHIVTEANTPGGTMKANLDGTWASDKGVLYMRRKAPEGTDFTADYDYKLSGNTLELTRRGMKSKQTYKRSSKN